MKLLISLCFIFLSPAFASADILFQGFNWQSWTKEGGFYNFLKSSVPELASAGITHVWLPPPSQSRDPEGYYPGRLYDLNASKYGSQAELKSLVEAFHQNGIKCIADIVVNHRSTEREDAQGVFFEGGTPDGRLDGGTSLICNNDPNFTYGTGSPDSGRDFPFGPDVDLLNTTTQQQLSDWMNWLKTDIGFDGWRFDFVIGYATSITKFFMEQTKPDFAVAEKWDDFTLGQENAHRNALRDWVGTAGGAITAFDFTTKFIFNQAIKGELGRLKDSNGNPAGMIGVLPQNAVTFIDNHDTWSQRLAPFSDDPDKVAQGYVYILTHPGIPSIFYDHFLEWGLKDTIKNLTAIRKKHGINPTSKVKILAAESDLYMAEIDEKIIMKIGPKGDLGNLLPSTYQLAYPGKDFAVWEKI
ncbi:hypothetical protein SCA6_008336 [Theobroma cacao]